MKRYNPKHFKRIEELTMSDIEAFYSTSVRRERDGYFITMVAPLLVCMALHERITDIIYLGKKFPLLDINGWTPELEEENRIQKKSFFYIANRWEDNTEEYNESVNIKHVVEFLELQETNQTKEFFRILKSRKNNNKAGEE